MRPLLIAAKRNSNYVSPVEELDSIHIPAGHNTGLPDVDALVSELL